MTPNLDGELLRTFLAVADARNFTRAGHAIGRTQSAVSIQMKRLEDMVGEPLFTRTARGAELTDKGHQLLANARRIVALLDETADMIRAEPIVGQVSVGIPDEYALSVLPNVLGRFAKKHPDVEISVVIDTSCEFPDEINNGSLDIAVMFAMPETQGGELLAIDQSVWVTSELHCVHDERPIPVAMYNECSPWVSGGWCRDYALRSLDRHGVDYRVSYHCNANGGLQAAVKSGMAIAPMSRSCIPDDCRELTAGEGFGPIDEGRVILLRNPNSRGAAIDELEKTIRSAFVSGGLTLAP